MALSTVPTPPSPTPFPHHGCKIQSKDIQDKSSYNIVLKNGYEYEITNRPSWKFQLLRASPLTPFDPYQAYFRYITKKCINLSTWNIILCFKILTTTREQEMSETTAVSGGFFPWTTSKAVRNLFSQKWLPHALLWFPPHCMVTFNSLVFWEIKPSLSLQSVSTSSLRSKSIYTP